MQNPPHTFASHFFDSFGEESPTEYPTLTIPTRIPYVGYFFKGGRVFVGYSYPWGILGRVFCRVFVWNSSLTATFVVESGCRYAKIDYCNLPSVFLETAKKQKHPKKTEYKRKWPNLTGMSRSNFVTDGSSKSCNSKSW